MWTGSGVQRLQARGRGSSYVDGVRGQRLYVRGFELYGRGPGAAAVC